MAENRGKFDKTSCQTSRDSKERKFRRVTCLIQELDMENATQEDEESTDLSEEDDNEPIVAKNDEVNPEPSQQDF